MNAVFAMEILNLISRVHLASFVILLPRQWKYFTFFSCFWSFIICTGDGCLEILITVVFPHSFPLRSIVQFQLSYQSCPILPFLRQPIAQAYLHMSQCTLPVLLIRSRQTLRSVGLRPLACWDCGFESRRGHGCLSLVCVVCCQVEVSVSGLIARPDETYRVWCGWVWIWILDNEEALAH